MIWGRKSCFECFPDAGKWSEIVNLKIKIARVRGRSDRVLFLNGVKFIQVNDRFDRVSSGVFFTDSFECRDRFNTGAEVTHPDFKVGIGVLKIGRDFRELFLESLGVIL